MSYQVQNPIVLIIFKRADTTAKVFERIREVRPKHLFIIADAGRPHIMGEVGMCERARKVTELVDWDCEVVRDYASHNLGCRARIPSGINLAFEKHEKLIILEDDCAPEVSFFQFCDELLDKYQDRKEVMSIGGFNSLETFQTEKSYHFGKYGDFWGWATWKDRWQLLNVDMPDWPLVKENIDERLSQLTSDERKIFSFYWDYVFEDGYDVWDYQWDFYRWLNGCVTITPSKSLVTNVGFGEDATNTQSYDHPLIAIPSTPMTFPMRHPVEIKMNSKFDNAYYEKVVREPVGKLGLNRFKRKVKLSLRKVFGEKLFREVVMPLYQVFKK